MTRGADKLENVLARLMSKRPELREGVERQEALECWPDVVGPMIAEHSRAISLHDGLLQVQVDGSVWAQELTMLQEDIKAAFACRLGDGAVREIRFHSGNL